MFSFASIVTPAIAGLTYPSEGDMPFEPIEWADSAAPSPATALEHLVGSGVPPHAVDVDSVISFVTNGAPESLASRFHELRALLERELSELTIFRVPNGVAQVDIYFIGKRTDDPQLWAGLKTTSIET